MILLCERKKSLATTYMHFDTYGEAERESASCVYVAFDFCPIQWCEGRKKHEIDASHDSAYWKSDLLRIFFIPWSPTFRILFLFWKWFDQFLFPDSKIRNRIKLLEIERKMEFSFEANVDKCWESTTVLIINVISSKIYLPLRLF